MPVPMLVVPLTQNPPPDPDTSTYLAHPTVLEAFKPILVAASGFNGPYTTPYYAVLSKTLLKGVSKYVVIKKATILGSVGTNPVSTPGILTCSSATFLPVLVSTMSSPEFGFKLDSTPHRATTAWLRSISLFADLLQTNAQFTWDLTGLGAGTVTVASGDVTLEANAEKNWVDDYEANMISAGFGYRGKMNVESMRMMQAVVRALKTYLKTLTFVVTVLGVVPGIPVSYASSIPEGKYIR